jgi:hypothetical protein
MVTEAGYRWQNDHNLTITAISDSFVLSERVTKRTQLRPLVSELDEDLGISGSKPLSPHFGEKNSKLKKKIHQTLMPKIK